MHHMIRSALLFCVLAALVSCGEFVGSKDDDVSIGKAQKLEVFLSDDNMMRFYSSVSTNESFSCSVIYIELKSTTQMAM